MSVKDEYEIGMIFVWACANRNEARPAVTCEGLL